MDTFNFKKQLSPRPQTDVMHDELIFTHPLSLFPTRMPHTVKFCARSRDMAPSISIDNV